MYAYVDVHAFIYMDMPILLYHFKSMCYRQFIYAAYTIHYGGNIAQYLRSIKHSDTHNAIIIATTQHILIYAGIVINAGT